ncbi:unnamed protein product [Brachionus calyciflorus]|uniref:Uncharacterized protein n=1 Tax=Brachionus calyciflorus TaxID=104777 RepID=A0A814K272_9BILA|nr:unnamed protein product [Brachionus calyciflorus]
MRRHSEVNTFQDLSSSEENDTIEQASDDEIEEERYDSNDVRTRGSTNKVESPESSDLYSLDSSSSSSSNNPDEQDQKSKFKVIKEFEKTLEFVKNASNLKVMPLVDSENKTCDDTLKKPHISLASLYYDRNNATNLESDSSSDEEVTNRKQESTNNNNNNNNRVNLIINNSLASHVDEKKPDVRDEDFVDDEMSVFKNETLNNQNKISDYKTFKIPLLPDKKLEQLPLSLQPIQIQPNDYLLKNNKIYNELKVFNNISNFDSTTTNLPNLNLNPLVGELPKNSTPIFSDNTTAAYLTAKRKKLLNAKLDLTIAPPTTDGQEAKPIERKPSNFMMPKVKSTPLPENFVTSTLRSTNNLQLSTKKSSKLLSVPGVETKVISGSLDLSKLSAIENVVTSTNLISVSKAEIPLDIKKQFKEEIKKDKSKCIIQ